MDLATGDVDVGGAVSNLQEDPIQAVTEGTALSGSDPFVQAGLKQLLLEAAFPMWMRSTDREPLSRRLGHSSERSTTLFMA